MAKWLEVDGSLAGFEVTLDFVYLSFLAFWFGFTPFFVVDF